MHLEFSYHRQGVINSLKQIVDMGINNFSQQEIGLSTEFVMEKEPVFNVDKYLRRINYSGTKEPNFTNLTSLCRCHATNVPEENLDWFGGQLRAPDLDRIYKNTVEEGRGGVCYEQNGLFGKLLSKLGYNVVLLEGRYYMQEKDEFSFPFNHMLLQVTLEGQDWLVDVRFGFPSFYLPLKMEVMTSQEQTTGIYRMRKVKGNEHEYFLEKRRKEIRDMDSCEIKSKQSKQQLSKYEIDPEWEIKFIYSDIPHTFEEFLPGWKTHFEDKVSFFRTNTLVQRFTDSGSLLLWGSIFIEMEFLGPLCEKVKRTEMLPGKDVAKEWNVLKDLIREKFRIVLDFKPNLARNHLI